MIPTPFERPSLLGLALAAGLAGCRVPYPQRLPGPLIVPGEARESVADGVAQVTLQRDSDPVWLRRVGERADVAVRFYAKRQRIPAGTLVRTGWGGRVELLWGSEATSLVLFDDGRCTVGDPEADEPVVRIHAVTHALLVLTPSDVVELPGGARLEGDASEPTGPFFLEQLGPLLRLTNQSKRIARVYYRSSQAEIGPGESIDLPQLEAGSAPATDPAESLQGAGVTVAFTGEVEREDSGPSLLLRAREPARVQALGVEVRLEPQQSARFSLLSLGSVEVPADASVRPDGPEHP